MHLQNKFESFLIRDVIDECYCMYVYDADSCSTLLKAGDENGTGKKEEQWRGGGGCWDLSMKLISEMKEITPNDQIKGCVT